MRREGGLQLSDLGLGVTEADVRVNDAADRGSYRAIELAPRSATLWTFTLRWRERGGHNGPQPAREKVIPYYHLGEIDQTGTSHLSLITTYSLVHMEGENLSPVISGMTRRQVEALQEWDAACWERPADAPLILRIWVEPLGKAARQP